MGNPDMICGPNISKNKKSDFSLKTKNCIFFVHDTFTT